MMTDTCRESTFKYVEDGLGTQLRMNASADVGENCEDFYWGLNISEHNHQSGDESRKYSTCNMQQLFCEANELFVSMLSENAPGLRFSRKLQLIAECLGYELSILDSESYNFV